MLSSKFVAAARRILSSPPIPILCTVALHGRGLVQQLHSSMDAEVIHVTHGNRDALVARVAKSLSILTDTQQPPLPTPVIPAARRMHDKDAV